MENRNVVVIWRNVQRIKPSGFTEQKNTIKQNFKQFERIVFFPQDFAKQGESSEN